MAKNVDLDSMASEIIDECKRNGILKEYFEEKGEDAIELVKGTILSRMDTERS